MSKNRCRRCEFVEFCPKCGEATRTQDARGNPVCWACKYGDLLDEYKRLERAVKEYLRAGNTL